MGGDDTRTTVTDFLDQQGIVYEVKSHTTPAYSACDVARERDVRLSQILKAMIGCDKEGNLIVAMIPGDRLLKLKKLRRAAGRVSIGLAHPSLLAEDLGLLVGAISPTQLVGLADFYMDQSVLAEKIVDISSGSPFAGVQLDPRDLAACLRPCICDLVSENGAARSTDQLPSEPAEAGEIAKAAQALAVAANQVM
jgi:prolyl-tRNA editing enzyme YbaK/EbsC (Cys-tRNA(Pro) deacylase)